MMERSSHKSLRATDKKSLFWAVRSPNRNISSQGDQGPPADIPSIGGKARKDKTKKYPFEDWRSFLPGSELRI